MNDPQIIEILNNNEMFNQVGMLSYVFRGIGWGFIKLMAFLSNNIENVVNKIYSLNGFFSSKYVDELLHQLFPIAWGVLAITILILGFKIMLNREFKLNGLVKNIIISVSIVMLLPIGMSQLSKITNAAIGGLKSEYKFSADKIIKDNLYDLYYLDTVNFKPNTTLKNKLPINSIKSIDINEEIDSSKIKNKDVCNSKISLDKNGKQFKDGLKKGIFSLFPENYYRFSFKFWTIAISIGCITFTLLITSIKISRIIFELGFIKLFGILYSFSDLSTGQKNKEIIRCVVSNFVVLFVISVLLKLYLLFSAWSTESSKGVVQIILLIGASLAVIDGPNLVERILGIDCGIKDGWSTITGINSAINTLAQTSHGMAKIMGSTVNGIANVGSSAVGMYNGFKEGMKPLEEQMNDKPLSNLDGFGKEDKEDKSNSKEQTSLHDEMKAQSNESNNVTDDSQNSNMQGDKQEFNSTEGSNVNNDLNPNSENNIDTNIGSEENKNSNFDINQDTESKLSSDIDANNTSSKVSNPTIDSENNKFNSGNYQGTNSNQSNISGDKGNGQLENNVSANENNKSDNSVANNSLENEMANITDASTNSTKLEDEMGSITGAPTEDQIGNIADAPIEDQIGNIADNPIEDQIGNIADNPIEDQIGNIADAPIEDQIGNIADSPIEDQIGNIADAPIEDQIGNIADAPIEDQIGNIADNPIEDQIGNIADSPIEDQIGNIADDPIEDQIGNIADAPIEDQIGNIADNPIENQIGNIADAPVADQIGNIKDAPVADQIGNIKDAPIADQVGNIKDAPIENKRSNFNANTGTQNINNNTSSPNLNTNSNIENQGTREVKSPIEHRTLSEHMKSNFQESTTFRGMKQNYSIGRNTGMKMASLIRNRKIKKINSNFKTFR